MNGFLRFRVRQYARYSLWLLPVTGLFAGLVLVRSLHWLESDLGWVSSFNVDGARAVLGVLAASMFTLVLFVASVLLIAFQLMSAQLSPRIIAIVFRDSVLKLALTTFLFTFAVTVATLLRVNTTVPLLTMQLTAYSCIGSLALFLYLMDHVGRMLRPSGALRSVARVGREVIEDVYPRSYTDSCAVRDGKVELVGSSQESSVMIVSPHEGVVLAFDSAGLVTLARKADCTIELVPEVGDFVATGNPLFRISPSGVNIATLALSRMVALGQERTVEQDPKFVFRILVDIAAKALSPAINDPTTAVLAIDQIHHLLRAVGTRNLSEGRVRDSEGRLRLIYPTPDWEDFVQMAVTEIRHYGRDSIQVVRRLLAMLEDLIRVLPKARVSILHHELKMLQKSADRTFSDPDDRAFAGVSDVQGVGGSHASKATKS